MKMSSYDIKNIYEWPILIKLFLFCLIALLIFYIGFLFDVRNLQLYIKNSRKQESDLISQFNDMVVNRTKIEIEISQLPSLQQTLNNWEKKLINPTEMPVVLDEIIKTASQEHIHVNLLDPQNEVKDNFYHKIPIKLQLSGSLDAIASFLSRISNMEKLIVIGDFSLSREQSGAMVVNKITKTTYTDQFSWEGTVMLYKK